MSGIYPLNIQFMKKLFFFAVCLFPFWTLAQFPVPMALTDSFSDHRNPDILSLQNYQSLIVWESSDSPDSASIHGTLMTFWGIPAAAEFKILGQSGVHFTHPKLMFSNHTSIPPQDTLCYLFYESDASGNKDILYLKYLSNGQFAGPYVFATSVGNETNLSISNSGVFQDVTLSWKAKDKVMVTRALWNTVQQRYIWDSIFVLDSGIVNNPVVSDDGMVVAWEKDMAGQSQIFWSEFNFTGMNWSSPAMFSLPGNHFGISQVKGLFGLPAGQFIWQATDGNQHSVICESISPVWGSYSYSSPFQMNDPVAAAAFIPVKNTLNPTIGLSAYSGDSLGNPEIFVNWMTPDAINLSNNPSADERPEVFILTGLGNMVYRLVLTWESFRNGHWQLWYTAMDISGSTAFTDREDTHFYGAPNPFRDRLSLSYSLPGDQEVRFRVLNSMGMLLYETPVIQGVKGQNSIDFSSYFTQDERILTPGLYFVEMRMKTEKKTIKLLKI